jgi:streptogramin lyase
MAQYANNTTQARVQWRLAAREVRDDLVRKLASYLATVNLSSAPTWPYALQTLPRPKGRASHVVITEYQVPRRTIAPHDVRTDAQGNVWYSNFVENFLGEIDPKTGEHREYAIPVLKPDAPTGTLDLEADADGNLWLAMMFQTGLAKFDMTTKTFQIFPVQAALDNSATQQSMVMPRAWHVDDKVWTNDVAKQSIMRLDVKTGKYELIDPFEFLAKGRQHSPYGMAADAQNQLYFMDFGDENIGRIDAKSGATTIYPTPTPKSRPRRTMLDDQGRLWFTEFAANKLGMFDTKSESFKEWDVPTPHTYPYDVFMDKNGESWSGGMASDRVLRFDPQSGRSIEYLLPRSTNIRRVFVDNSTNPVTFWAGNNHGAEILRIEPLD